MIANGCTEYSFQSREISIGYARFPTEGLKKGVIDIEKIGGFGKRKPLKSAVHHTLFKKGRNIVFQLFFTEILFPVQNP